MQCALSLTHIHTLVLALLSPWVVCAANVYDLNQANPTGLFQWIENDLQDAVTGPRREEEIRGNLRAPFQVTLWLELHTCLYVCSHAYLHLFLPQSCGIPCLCLFHFPPHRLDGLFDKLAELWRYAKCKGSVRLQLPVKALTLIFSIFSPFPNFPETSEKENPFNSLSLSFTHMHAI